MGDGNHGVAPRSPSGPKRSPCQRLEAIVDVLLAAGNVPNTNGFVSRPDGFAFELLYPIDFELVRASCNLPKGVVLSEEHDTIPDRLTWCAIQGPGARAMAVVQGGS